MIDEKKIEEALNQYVDDDSIYDFGLFARGFKEGINWFLDNLCHKASEEPEPGKLLLCQCSNREYLTLTNKINFGEWSDRCEFVGITRWLYIDDLLKGQAMASCPFDSRLFCTLSDGRYCYNEHPCTEEYRRVSNKQKKK